MPLASSSTTELTLEIGEVARQAELSIDALTLRGVKRFMDEQHLKTAIHHDRSPKMVMAATREMARART